MKPAIALATSLAIGFGAASRAPAQEPEVPLQKHAFYLEVGGNASRYSLNYERAFDRHHRLRFGGAIWTGGETQSISEAELNFPLMYNLILREGSHHIEVGAGVLFGAVTKPRRDMGERSTTYWSATGTVGYRHQFPANEWLFRIGFTPIYGFGPSDVAYPRRGFVPRFGVSIGRAFN